MKKKTEYVLGFLFNLEGTKVALIKKNRPIFQYNKLNGIGGKIEDGESKYEAMIREFNEETGVNIPIWSYIGQMEGLDWITYCYKCFDEQIYQVKTITDEEVFIVDIESLKNYKKLSNVLWLVNICLDKNPFKFKIKYSM